MSVGEATRVSDPRPILVHGYLDAPPDDVDRLCAGYEGGCVPPSIEIRGLDARRVVGAKEGCCAIGYFSAHELVIRGVVAEGVFYVLRDAS
jgi:hypothetical protein